MKEKTKKLLKKVKSSKVSKKIKKILPTIILVIMVGVVSFIVGKRIGLNTDTSTTNTKIEEATVEKHTITKTLTSSGQIESATTEKLYLSTSYYFSSLCVEEDDIVKKGENILKYTNGTYLTAPYDLVVTSISVPTANTIASSSNYIEVKSMDTLVVSLKVSESEIANISLDDEAEITLTADSSKKYTGKISKISSVATYSSSGSTFPIEITLENDEEDNIKIGMSVSCTINIEELKDVIAVPINAVQINGSKRYVVLIKDGKTEEVEVTTGLSDDEYVEIKSGLDGGETIQIVTVTKQNTIRSNSGDNGNGNSRKGGGMPNDGNFGGERPSNGNDSGRQRGSNNQPPGQGN